MEEQVRADLLDFVVTNYLFGDMHAEFSAGHHLEGYPVILEPGRHWRHPDP